MILHNLGEGAAFGQLRDGLLFFFGQGPVNGLKFVVLVFAQLCPQRVQLVCDESNISLYQFRSS